MNYVTVKKSWVSAWLKLVRSKTKQNSVSMARIEHGQKRKFSMVKVQKN
jgi:hypothetical protein